MVEGAATPLRVTDLVPSLPDQFAGTAPPPTLADIPTVTTALQLARRGSAWPLGLRCGDGDVWVSLELHLSTTSPWHFIPAWDGVHGGTETDSADSEERATRHHERRREMARRFGLDPDALSDKDLSEIAALEARSSSDHSQALDMPMPTEYEDWMDGVPDSFM